MNRWMMIGSMVGLLTMSTGCLHHHARKNCQSCQGHQGVAGGHGLLGGQGGCRQGCVAGPLGWQQGGHDYSSHLQPGLTGHRAAAQVQGQPFNAGPPSPQVAYPYYTHRGPRDFLLDNPPSIGR